MSASLKHNEFCATNALRQLLEKRKPAQNILVPGSPVPVSS
ncbi:MAG: hypothetical protein WAM53_10195 [Terrimicrobiaceae bacterium]